MRGDRPRPLAIQTGHSLSRRLDGRLPGASIRATASQPQSRIRLGAHLQESLEFAILTSSTPTRSRDADRMKPRSPSCYGKGSSVTCGTTARSCSGHGSQELCRRTISGSRPKAGPCPRRPSTGAWQRQQGAAVPRSALTCSEPARPPPSRSGRRETSISSHRPSTILALAIGERYYNMAGSLEASRALREGRRRSSPRDKAESRFQAQANEGMNAMRAADTSRYSHRPPAAKASDRGPG